MIRDLAEMNLGELERHHRIDGILSQVQDTLIREWRKSGIKPVNKVNLQGIAENREIEEIAKSLKSHGYLIAQKLQTRQGPIIHVQVSGFTPEQAAEIQN